MDDQIRIFPAQTSQAPTFREPDLTNIDVWQCRLRCGQEILRIFIHQRAKNIMLQHAYSMPDREVGGVMIGTVHYHYDSNKIIQYYVDIYDALPAPFTEGNAVQLTFTGETWSETWRTIEQTYPNKNIVGWYHTHPGHGIFLSGDDKFIQNNFFYHDRQLAFVIDHIQTQSGFFVGSELSPTGICQSPILTWDAASYRSTTPHSPLYPGAHPTPIAPETSLRAAIASSDSPRSSKGIDQDQSAGHPRAGRGRPRTQGWLPNWLAPPGRPSTRKRSEPTSHRTPSLVISETDIDMFEDYSAINRGRRQGRSYAEQNRPRNRSQYDSTGVVFYVGIGTILALLILVLLDIAVLHNTLVRNPVLLVAVVLLLIIALLRIFMSQHDNDLHR